MKSRLSLPEPARMSPEQRAVHDDVLRTRGNLHGPFLAWILSPGLAAPAQQLGAFCRYGSSLALVESELLILRVAAHFDCPAEQAIHEPIAVKAGLSEKVVQALGRGESPSLATPRLQLLSDCAGELLRENRLTDAMYARARETFGETTLVEIVGVVGYYTFVAYTLNAFDMRLD